MLNPNKLKNVRQRGDKVIAQCPACAEAGHDQTGDHLVIFPDGKFGCAANPGDAEHRKRIWRLAGTPGKRMPPPPCGGYIQFKKETKPKLIRVVNVNSTDASDGYSLLAYQKITGMDTYGDETTPTTDLGGTVGAKKASETSEADTQSPAISSAASGEEASEVSEAGSKEPGTFMAASGNKPSEPSGGATTGAGAIPVGPTPNEPSEVSADTDADQALDTPTCGPTQDEASDPSEDMIEQAAQMFGGKVTTIPAGGDIPDEFLDVIATWKVVREHPAWKDHPQIKNYKPERIYGWTPLGRPVLEKHLKPLPPHLQHKTHTSVVPKPPA